jgi:hypothetical protein
MAPCGDPPAYEGSLQWRWNTILVMAPPEDPEAIKDDELRLRTPLSSTTLRNLNNPNS